MSDAAFYTVTASRALGLVVDARVAQLDRHGYSAAADATLPPHHLPAKARDYAQIASECANPLHSAHDPVRARKKLAEAGRAIVAASNAR